MSHESVNWFGQGRGNLSIDGKERDTAGGKDALHPLDWVAREMDKALQADSPAGRSRLLQDVAGGSAAQGPEDKRPSRGMGSRFAVAKLQAPELPDLVASVAGIYR